MASLHKSHQYLSNVILSRKVSQFFTLISRAKFPSFLYPNNALREMLLANICCALKLFSPLWNNYVRNGTERRPYISLLKFPQRSLLALPILGDFRACNRVHSSGDFHAPEDGARGLINMKKRDRRTRRKNVTRIVSRVFFYFRETRAFGKKHPCEANFYENNSRHVL